MSLQHFNPHDMAEDMVRQVATGREEVLQDILTTVQHNLQQKPNQHLLAVAPRGYGKSFLARLVALHLKELHDNQGLKIAVALLPEEQPNVTEPYLLLEEICRVLEGKPADSVIPTWYDENSDSLVWEQSLKKIDGALDSKFGAGQGLLVAIVENFDQLLLTVFRDEEAQSRLRKLLSEHPRLMWLATSTSAALDKSYDARLFHAFRQLDLEPWTEQQCIDYFNRQLQALGQEPLAAEGLARARTLAVFIGGTPRLATLLAEVLANKDAGKAAVVLDTLVDRLTPYYKHRIESLAARPRKLLDALLRVGEPCSQSTLAQRVGAGQAAVAQPFQELQRERMVIGQRASGGREMLYRVSDRVLAHYYRKRFLNHGQALSPLEAIAEFLEAFFSLDEKRNEAGRLRTLGREHDAAVLERLVAREVESVGSWRARVFDINYRLREYAKIIAPTALDRFGEVFAAFTDCRFTEALRLFGQIEQQEIPDNEWLIALLLKASLLVQLTERRNEGFTFLEAAADFAEKNSSAEWQFAAYSIRGNWLWQLGERNLSIAIIKKTIFLQNDLQGQFMKLEASFVQGWVEANENHYEQAISLLNETALQAKAVGCTFIACRAKKVQCYSLGQLRQHEKAVKAAEEAIRWAAEIGDEREQALGIRHCIVELGSIR